MKTHSLDYFEQNQVEMEDLQRLEMSFKHYSIRNLFQSIAKPSFIIQISYESLNFALRLRS